jgi:ribosomal protein RSM22 (predicted rRNA methylase)
MDLVKCAVMSPDEYIARIKEELNAQGQGGTSALKLAYEDLSKRYRGSNASGFRSKAEMAAYIQARFPATHAVLDHILEHEIHNKNDVKSVLDLGAGPGTATLAALNHFSLSHATLVEQTPELIEVARAVLRSFFSNCDFTFHSESVHNADFLKSDLVILSYLLTEMSERQALNVYEKSLSATKAYNLVVLPGTSTAFKLLLQLRDRAIALGYHVLAPCPHMQACPMTRRADQWCHFRQRLNRSRAHQDIKKGTVGYEDEPYFYLLVAPKGLSQDPFDRIINSPRHRPGHIYMDVCSPSGVIETKCITKKDKVAYKAAKDLNWGDKIQS